MATNRVCVGGGLFVDADGILKVRPDGDTLRLVNTPQGDVLSLFYRPAPPTEWPYGQNPGWGQKVFGYNGQLYGAPPSAISYLEVQDAMPQWGYLNHHGDTYRIGARMTVTNNDTLRRNVSVFFMATWGGYNTILPPGAKAGFLAQTAFGSGTNPAFPASGGVMHKHHNIGPANQEVAGHSFHEFYGVPVLNPGRAVTLAIRWRIHPSLAEHYVPAGTSIIGGFYHCKISAMIMALS